MEAYFTRDKDPHGGNYDVFREMPDLEHLRNTVQEIRQGDMPADVWLQIAFAEHKPDPDNHYDEHYIPYFNEAKVVWTREGGFVDANE